MPKIDLETAANLQNEASFVEQYNANLVKIETAFDDVLFREGDGAASANAMQGDLDMNSQRILNLPAPTDDLEAARHGDLQTYVTDAEAAQTAAETAQTAAETAQTAAETAQTAAETAETNAETAETGAQAILDEIETHGINSGTYTPVSLGTVSSGTITPEPSDGVLQTATNGGAFTISAPTETGWYRLVWENNASAGAVTLSGFDKVWDDDSGKDITADESIIELNVVNDGVAKTAQISVITDTTP